MEARNRKKLKPCGFQPPFRGSQSPEASSPAGTFNVLVKGKVSAIHSEVEPSVGFHSDTSSSPAAAFELAAAYTNANCQSPRHCSYQGTKTDAHLSKSPLSKTLGVLDSHAKCQTTSRNGSCSEVGNSTTASKAKRLATTMHARALKCPAKLLTHKLSVSHRPKISTVLGQVLPMKTNAGMCSLTEEKSLGRADSAKVAELSVYDLPPTQPDVASEQHAKKTTISKRKRVLTQEQRLVHKEVLIMFERLRAEIEQIREQYGDVLNDVYSKQTVTKDANELWFECNEE